ncbi:MAG: carbohydrate ABC transporter permease [bacterium]|nr:carbohydrate ABC transporter permease [bacterium]
MIRKEKICNFFIYLILCVLVVLFFAPVFFVILNSFKEKLYISSDPFSIPKGEMFASLSNYTTGIERTSFFHAFGWSTFITVGSVLVILLCTAMTAWYITRVKSKLTSFLYYMFVFSMVVPFQMVMFTMSKLTDTLHLNTPWGMIVIYLGFGAGLSVFMFSGFVKSIPVEIEEAALIDGCSPIKMFFTIIVPILKPTVITVAILNTMWIWNDYLLPYLTIGLSTEYKTIPVVVQYLMGSYGAKDYGALMALLVLAIIPIIIFYLCCQKYIIKGVVAGAVKG